MTCFRDVARTSRLRTWQPKISVRVRDKAGQPNSQCSIVSEASPQTRHVGSVVESIRCWYARKRWQWPEHIWANRTNNNSFDFLPAMIIFRINWHTVVAVDCSHSRVCSRRVWDETRKDSCSSTYDIDSRSTRSLSDRLLWPGSHCRTTSTGQLLSWISLCQLEIVMVLPHSVLHHLLYDKKSGTHLLRHWPTLLRLCIADFTVLLYFSITVLLFHRWVLLWLIVCCLVR